METVLAAVVKFVVTYKYTFAWVAPLAYGLAVYRPFWAAVGAVAVAVVVSPGRVRRAVVGAYGRVRRAVAARWGRTPTPAAPVVAVGLGRVGVAAAGAAYVARDGAGRWRCNRGRFAPAPR